VAMATDQELSDELLGLYNEVDHFLRTACKSDKFVEHGFLIQEISASNSVVARNQQLLRSVGQIRNNIVHNPIPKVAQPLVSPNPELVKAYRSVRDALLNPPGALNIAIPRQQIFTSTLDAPLAEILQAMSQNIFTHVPIMEGDKMIGVFSENTLLSYLAETGETIITNDMTMRDFEQWLPLESHRGEHFVFLPRKTPLSKVYEVFNEAIKVRRRIGMIFITQNGKDSEKLLGIITAWDLANPELGR
jgi:CBS domain-containing protein